MATFETTTAELTRLGQALESGSWRPSARERACASLVLAGDAGLPTADTLVAAVRACGPDLAMPGGGPLAAVLTSCAALTRLPSAAASAPGQQLRAATETLLHAVRRAPGDVEEERQLARDCLADIKYQYQQYRWDVVEADLTAAVATGLTGNGVRPLLASTVGYGNEYEQAKRMVAQVPALRHAANLPSTGPLPLALTAIADVCESLREPVATAIQAGLDVDRAAGPDGLDLVRQIGEAELLLSRFANSLGSLLVR
jgi:hypothetical protein